MTLKEYIYIKYIYEYKICMSGFVCMFYSTHADTIQKSKKKKFRYQKFNNFFLIL